MLSLKVRGAIIVVILIIAGLIAFYYVRKARQPPGDQTPEQEIKTNIAKGGVFLVGPRDSGGNQALIYRDKSNNYYNGGSCADCGDACAKALLIQDVNKTDCSSGICKPVLVSSAKDVTALYLQKAGNKVMTQIDCAALIDTSGDADATYINQQTMALFAQSSNDMWMDLKSFLSKHKDQIIQIIGQLGTQKALERIIGEYAAVVIAIPGLFSSDTRTSSEIQIGYFGGRAALKNFASILKNFTAETADKFITTGSETVLEVSTRAVTEALAENALKMAARGIARALVMVVDALDPVFAWLDIVMIVGMVFDVIDPCGLTNTLSKEDIDTAKKALDYALFNVMLDATGTGTPQWYAEYISQYELTCPDSDSKTLTLSRKDFNRLTRPGNAFTGIGDDCKDNETKLTQTYSQLYQDNLTLNSVGQCIRPLTKQELDELCSSALGIPVDLPIGRDVIAGADTGIFSQFKKAAEFITLDLADDNQVVANFMVTYWYVVVLVLVIIAVIAFFL